MDSRRADRHRSASKNHATRLGEPGVAQRGARATINFCAPQDGTHGKGSKPSSVAALYERRQRFEISSRFGGHPPSPRLWRDK
jgi:hypothetical protein